MTRFAVFDLVSLPWPGVVEPLDIEAIYMKAAERKGLGHAVSNWRKWRLSSSQENTRNPRFMAKPLALGGI